MIRTLPPREAGFVRKSVNRTRPLRIFRAFLYIRSDWTVAQLFIYAIMRRN